MQLLFGHDAEVGSFVAARLGVTLVPPYTAIGVLGPDGTLRGGIVYHDYNGANVEMTIWGPGAMRRGVLAGAFHYPFRQLGCTRVTAHTRRANKPVRDMLPRLGFRFEGVSPRYFGPSRQEDAFTFGMLKQDCRWINAHEISQSTNAA